jgi:hypothetical protein
MVMVIIIDIITAPLHKLEKYGPIDTGFLGDRNRDMPSRGVRLPPFGQGAHGPINSLPLPRPTLETPIGPAGPPKGVRFGDPGISRKTLLLGFIIIIFTCGILLLYVDWSTIIGCFEGFNQIH